MWTVGETVRAVDSFVRKCGSHGWSSSVLGAWESSIAKAMAMDRPGGVVVVQVRECFVYGRKWDLWKRL